MDGFIEIIMAAFVFSKGIIETGLLEFQKDVTTSVVVACIGRVLKDSIIAFFLSLWKLFESKEAEGFVGIVIGLRIVDFDGFNKAIKSLM